MSYNFLFNRVAPKQKATGDIHEGLSAGFRSTATIEVVKNGLLLRQGGVNMLRINAKLTTMSPTTFSLERLEGIDHCSQERRFALAVVTHDDSAVSMLDF